MRAASLSPAIRQWLAVGTGVGVEITPDQLHVTVARVRPRKAEVVASATFVHRGRPAAEWGAEYQAFLKKSGAAHLAATVLLPRREVLVRQITLPGVAQRDIAAAIALQIDTLHPYAENDAVWSWEPLGTTGAVLIGITRRSVIERYSGLFAEAGMKVATLGFSAAVMYSGIRMNGPREESDVLALCERDGEVEVYGESAARTVFSALFDMPSNRAQALAAAELRVDASAARGFGDVLPAPSGDAAEVGVLSYAAALAAACPWLAAESNLMPVDSRSASSRLRLIPTAVLASLLAIVGAALLAQPAIEDRRYRALLEQELARVEPDAKKASAMEGQIAKARARAQLLDEFRGRSKDDLDALMELTKILASPVWLSAFDLTRSSLTVVGEADQAAPLLETIDKSPRFANSEFAQPISRLQGGEVFRIRAAREGVRAE